MSESESIAEHHLPTGLKITDQVFNSDQENKWGKNDPIKNLPSDKRGDLQHLQTFKSNQIPGQQADHPAVEVYNKKKDSSETTLWHNTQ